MEEGLVLFWFRRDLRLDDNAGLFHALVNNPRVLPLYIFDTDVQAVKNDARNSYIYQRLAFLHDALGQMGSTLLTAAGSPTVVFGELLNRYKITAVYTNKEYEPAAIARDAAVKQVLAQQGIPLHSFKDQVVMEERELLKDDGKPYTVFTPYAKRWKMQLKAADLQEYDVQRYAGNFKKLAALPLPELQGPAAKHEKMRPAVLPDAALIQNYHRTRDIPALAGTSRLSAQLRYGALSIRGLVRFAREHSETWLNELLWREFYTMILFHFPYVTQGAFKKQYDHINWRNDEAEFKRWCEGKTGYPIVDAGMRELNGSGFMHNRLRMITAGFLTKHLLIDWRWGEQYFAEKLVDYDLAANNGGWQWCAGSGCDAAPYFRIFNPHTQTQKFDPELQYIKKWLPEYPGTAYPAEIIAHETARSRALAVYKESLAARAGTF